MLERSKGDGSLFRWACVKRSYCVLLLMSFAGAGCSSTWIQESRLAPTGLASQDAIALIVTAPIKDEQLPELEGQVAGCVQSALSGTHPDIRIVYPNEFRKLVFPNLTIHQIPSGYFAWQSLLRDPTFHGKLAPLGLRYVLAVDAEQGSRLTTVEWTAATSMFGGPGPTLSASWEHSVLMQAIVIDARHRRVAGGVQAYTTGRSGAGVSLVTFPSPFLLPHGMPSFPFGGACRGLGEALAKFLTEESSAAEQATNQR